MNTELPPVCNVERISLQLRLMPRDDREDAVQEAWLAYLSGNDPTRAVNAFAQRERRLRRRMVGAIPPELS